MTAAAKKPNYNAVIEQASAVHHRWFLATQKIDTVVRENLSINFGSDISVALASQRKIPQHVATKGHRILPLDVISYKRSFDVWLRGTGRHNFRHSLTLASIL